MTLTVLPEQSALAPEKLKPTAQLLRGILFDRVCFQYSSVSNNTSSTASLMSENSAPPFGVKNVSFFIPSGSTVAIIGRNGSGKSTLAALLCRLYRPDSGRILWDGTDISTLPTASWEGRVAVVPQDVGLLNRSIRDNIAMGDAKATEDDIIRVSKLARAHDFISALPNGYNTNIGEKGLRLSGGQRQRLAIARALLMQSAVLVLDESASQLDAESETAIGECLQSIRMQSARDKGHALTQIIIAHRINSVSFADVVVVLEDGKVSGVGSHQELRKSNQTYQLWLEAQSDHQKP